MRVITNGQVGKCNLYDSLGGDNDVKKAYALRPVVTLKSTVQVSEASETTDGVRIWNIIN